METKQQIPINKLSLYDFAKHYLRILLPNGTSVKFSQKDLNTLK